MDVRCTYQEFPFPVSQDRTFKAFKAIVKDGNNLIPKLLPDFVANTDSILGDGGPGTIKRVDMSSGAEEHYRVDIFDSENYVYKATLIKSGLLREKVASIVQEIRFQASGPDRCIVKIATEYHAKDGKTFEEEEIERITRISIKFFQALGAYLLANPDAYM